MQRSQDAKELRLNRDVLMQRSQDANTVEVVASVPEPGSLILLLLGVAGLYFYVGRKPGLAA